MLRVLVVQVMTGDGCELLDLTGVADKEGLDGGGGSILKGASRLGASSLENCRPKRELDPGQRCWRYAHRILDIRTHLRAVGCP
jgi:hypothetical protein